MNAFSHFGVSVQGLVLALLIAHLQARTEDDSDGPSFNGNNNTHSSMLTLNQAGRFPFSNNNLPFSRFPQPSQFNSQFQQQPLSSLSSFNGGFPQNGLSGQQNPGFSQQNGQFNGAFGLPQSQFGSPGFQSQLVNPQFGFQNPFGSQNLLGISNQFGGNQQPGIQSQFGLNNFPGQFGLSNNLQNQLTLQNQQQQIGFQQSNPFGLNLQNQQFGLQQQNNQLGIQNSLGQNAATGNFGQIGANGLQNQNQFLGFQQNPFQQQQNIPFQQSPLLNSDLSGSPFGLLGNSPFLGTGSTLGLLGGNQFGFNPLQSSLGTRGLGLGTGSSSFLLPSNQILLQGGQFQDSVPATSQLGGSNRFQLNNNRFASNNIPGFSNPILASGSQFNSQFSSDPPFNQRPIQQQPSFPFAQQQRPSQNGVLNERSLSFTNATSSSNGESFQQQINQKPALQQQQPPFGQRNRVPVAGAQEQFFPELSSEQQPSGNPPPFPFHPQKQQLTGLFPSPVGIPLINVGQTFSFQGSADPSNSEQFSNLQTPSMKQQVPLPIPDSGFSCSGRLPGYYADLKTKCKTFHICKDDGTTSGQKNSFACPNGTLFSQAHTTCTWAEEVDCSVSQLYYPQLDALTQQHIQSTGGGKQPRPAVTTSPFSTQIPPPLNSSGGTPSTTPPTRQIGTGQPSPAMGSLDFGRSLQDDVTNFNSNTFPEGNNFSTPPFRPSLFRATQQVRPE